MGETIRTHVPLRRNHKHWLDRNQNEKIIHPLVELKPITSNNSWIDGFFTTFMNHKIQAQGSNPLPWKRLTFYHSYILVTLDTGIRTSKHALQEHLSQFVEKQPLLLG